MNRRPRESLLSGVLLTAPRGAGAAVPWCQDRMRRRMKRVIMVGTAATSRRRNYLKISVIYDVLYDAFTVPRYPPKCRVTERVMSGQEALSSSS